jgi:hypothetical protein
MTKRATGATKRRPVAPEGDPGQYLPLLAAGHADRTRRPKAPLSWSQALAAAPWDPSLPAAWESAFREAYARRLVELGSALPAKRAGTRSGTRGRQYATTLERRLLSQTREEFDAQDARAKAEGLPWSTWARRKLAM